MSDLAPRFEGFPIGGVMTPREVMNHRTEISTLLLTQHGLITKQQVLAAGFTARTVSRALGRGAYEEVLPGVLRSVQHPVTFESRAMAAQLHAGPGAALSGPTAARLYGLRGMLRRARLVSHRCPFASPTAAVGDADRVGVAVRQRRCCPRARRLATARPGTDAVDARRDLQRPPLRAGGRGCLASRHRDSARSGCLPRRAPEPWATGLRTIRPLDRPHVGSTETESERIRARCARCGASRRPARAGAPVPGDAGDRRGRPSRSRLA